MALNPGTRLGPYEVTAQIGVGGMGEVYRATDTNLKRQVAIKVLPEAVAVDPDRLARFQREAEVLAALNHPNIAQIYGVERSDGTTALVMELIEGPTLADRIARSPIPIDDALPIAKQITEALEAAHERGIIHRDLKPANIKVRDDGTVKVLDFGLAKAMEPAEMSPGVSQAPTLTSPAMTQAGVILGTAAYMAPEQARGKAVDKRADIWAFGVVLYEMLTGGRLFAGDDLTETIAAVVMKEPDLTAAPPRVQRLLHKCLEKDPKKRLHDIGDAWELVGDPATAGAAVPGPSRLRWALTVAVSIGLGAAAAWVLKPAPVATSKIVRVSHRLPSGEVFTNTGRTVVSVTRDGTRVAYVANSQLYLWNLNEQDSQARPISGTAVTPIGPSFSPDGNWIAFFSMNRLWKVPVAGGTPVPLCEAANPLGTSWTPDDWIVYGQADGIRKVSANGGTSELVIASQPGEQLSQPQVLPDGKTLLYSVGDSSIAAAPDRWDAGQIAVQPLAGGARTMLGIRGFDARYVSTGHVIYAVGNTLFAVPFDLTRLAVTGGAAPVVEGAYRNGFTAHYDVSDDGALAYLAEFGSLGGTLAWVDRHGSGEPLGVPSGAWMNPRLSPDGTTIAVERREGPADMWLWDVTARRLRQLTTDPTPNYLTAWFPDSRRLVVTYQTPLPRVYEQNADGSGVPRLLVEGSGAEFADFPYAVTRDGGLVYGAKTLAGVADIWWLPRGGTPQPLLQTPALELNGAVSPDERWMAFDSNRTGTREVYVRQFPNVDGPEWPVTRGGGCCPVWARDGSELYYWVRNGTAGPVTIMAVPVMKGTTFNWGTATAAAKGNDWAQVAQDTPYDVAKDGRFLVVKPADDADATPPEVRVVLDWTEELRRLVPAN